MVMTPSSGPQRVLIIGGGLAGLAAATALAPRGFDVTLLESRNRLGGRAGSFQDAATGQLIDTCQHVSMGCCTNVAHFFRTVGVAHLLQPQPCLYFMTPDGRISRFRADALPAPFHLARSFLAAHFLSASDKLRIGWGLAQLARPEPADDPPFADWLAGQRQTQRTIDRFWGLVLVSALNETPERIGLKYARKVFRDAFLKHRRGFDVEVPTVPLGRLYGVELQTWLQRHGVALHLQRGAGALDVHADRVVRLRTRSDEPLEADWYIAAVPFDRLLELLPSELVQKEAYFGALKNLETAPITSVHCWFDRAATELPHVVLVGCIGQWVFQRGVEQGAHYYQVVVSAARQFRGLGREAVQAQVVDELRRLFPRLHDAELRRCRVITEHAATISVVPGVDRWRPGPESPLRNLFCAGDWTATGWPATMESAVRSGYQAAEALLARVGRPTRLVQPDLA
jgi:squalene-associated FAD-dependent desaturase